MRMRQKMQAAEPRVSSSLTGDRVIALANTDLVAQYSFAFSHYARSSTSYGLFQDLQVYSKYRTGRRSRDADLSISIRCARLQTHRLTRFGQQRRSQQHTEAPLRPAQLRQQSEGGDRIARAPERRRTLLWEAWA